jgi:hypothetical protein
MPPASGASSAMANVRKMPVGQITGQAGELPVQPHLQKYFDFRLTQIKSI